MVNGPITSLIRIPVEYGVHLSDCQVHRYKRHGTVWTTEPVPLHFWSILEINSMLNKIIDQFDIQTIKYRLYPR